MFCKKCGNQVSESAVFCKKCGSKLVHNKIMQHATDSDVIVELDKPALQASLISGIKDTQQTAASDDMIEVSTNHELLENLIGKNANYYLGVFDKIENGKKSFNWCAFLFGSILTLYRKQLSFFAKAFLPVWMMSFIVPVINIILYKFGRTTSGITNFEYITIINIIQYIWAFAASVFCGINFNKSYRNKLYAVTNHLKSTGLSQPHDHSFIKKLSPSAHIPLGVISIYIILIFVVQANTPSINQLVQAPFMVLSDGTAMAADNEVTTAGESSTVTSANNEAITISIEEYQKAFEENPLAADNKFRDKMFEFTGEIDWIGKINNGISISLRNDEWQSVVCNYDSNHLDEILDLKTGDIVTIRGISRGYDGSYNLDECVLVYNSADEPQPGLTKPRSATDSSDPSGQSKYSETNKGVRSSISFDGTEKGAQILVEQWLIDHPLRVGKLTSVACFNASTDEPYWEFMPFYDDLNSYFSIMVDADTGDLYGVTYNAGGEKFIPVDAWYQQEFGGKPFAQRGAPTDDFSDDSVGTIDDALETLVIYYKSYLQSINEQDATYVRNATSKQKQLLKERMFNTNKDYLFEFHQIIIDMDTVSLTESQGTQYLQFYAAFQFSSKSRTGNKDKEAAANIQLVKMVYHNDLDDWVVDDSVIQSGVTVSANQRILK